MMSKWIFENRPVPRYTSVSTGSTVRQPTPIGTTTVARPPHTSALGVSSETITAYARRARGVERRPPGAGSLPLRGNGADPHERRFSQHLRRPFPPGVAPTLTSTQRFYTKFDMQTSTLFSRYKYPQKCQDKIPTPISILKFPHKNQGVFFQK